jgi:hypothetical protein
VKKSLQKPLVHLASFFAAGIGFFAHRLGKVCKPALQRLHTRPFTTSFAELS